MSNILTSLVICGLLGLIGQGARAIAGLSNSQALAGGTTTQQSNFNAAYLTVSLIIGFIAGVLAGIALGVVDEGNTSLSRATMLGLIAAGYAGTDFIENTLAKLLPQVGAVGSSVSFTGVQKQASTAAIMTSQSAVNANVSPAQASFDLELAVRKLLPNLDGAHWIPLLNDAFNRFNMNTPLRVAAAMGQFIAEAGESFNGLRENMNYSASGLLKNFPNEIDEVTANRLAGNPQAIANHVYANRNGNGDEASGDGFKFRGGGLCQLTGRAEYTKFANDMGMDVDHAAAYVETAEGAAISGCWYLSVNGCLPLADQWRLTQITGIVNRAMLGLNTRINYANQFRNTFGVAMPGSLVA